MKQIAECKHCHYVVWGILIALFGVFLLIANFSSNPDLMRYWPIFLVAAGIYKAACACCCKHKS